MNIDIEQAEFRQILEIAPDLCWVEILNQEQADLATELTMTAVGPFYRSEADKNRGQPAPHRWFLLIDARGEEPVGQVVMAAPGPGVKTGELTANPLHITGYTNRKPYPEWTAAIASLSAATGIPMPPNYMGHMLEADEAVGTKPTLN